MGKLDRLADKIGAVLLGKELPGENVSPENKLVNSFFYGIDDLPASRVSPENKIVRADFGKLPELEE